MTIKKLHMGSCGIVALAVASATPAFASGTTAGSSITNTASISYSVGGVSQPSVNSNTDSFVVDRKVNLTVAEVGSATTVVAPGQTGAYTSFTLQNTSNAVLDFALTTAQTSGGTAAHGGTDNFDVTGVTIYRDTNGNNVYDAGTDTAVTYIDELAADATVTLFVVGNVPAGRATGDVSNVRLTATGREGGTAGSMGAALVQTAGANTAAMDTVFADGAGVSDAARDAAHSDDDDYTVATATLTVSKSSSVVSDPINNTTNPKAIPGAVISYCIQVANASGGAAATSVSVSDVVPANMTYVASSIRLNGTVTSGVCNADGVAGGSFSAGTVSGTIATVAAGDTRTLVFQATIN